MKRTVLLMCATAMVVAGAGGWADTFRFAYSKGDQYRIVSQVKESVYVNGSFSHDSDILDKIAVTVTDTNGQSGNHEALYQTSERAYGSLTEYTWSEEYASRFWQDGRGAETIDPSYFMPMVRNVPLFPEGDIQPGATWSAPGSEVHDFRANFGIDAPFSFPISVSYTYVGKETRGGVACAVFAVSYEIFHAVTGTQSSARMYPTRVAGVSQQKLWWDLEKRRPAYDEETFDFLYTFNTGDEVEYKGTSQGILIPAVPLDRSQVAQDIQRQLTDQGVQNVTVAPTDQGVKITLENVNFPPNSDTLLPAEQDKLRRIAEILMKYPDRDIAVQGFTARAAGYTEEDYQQLSDQRASAAARYLLSLGARAANQMIVRGMGASSPIGDNATEAGRMKNRRVEITILEN